MSIKEVSQFCEKHELLSRIKYLESKIEKLMNELAMADKLSLSGAGGVTRRMTDEEKIELLKG